ncbi:transporter [Cupriavidus necator]|nr:transporter [Cupriavidus necator]
MAAAVLIGLAPSVHAEDSEELAKKLSNPVAALVSVPFQFNYDRGIGPARDGERWTMNFQPVVPVSLSEDWNLISRTIVPVTYQSSITPGSGSQAGLGDTVQSLFFSPKAPTASGLIWGVGPALSLPTGTENQLSGRKWGLGPTAVGLIQHGPWTYGALGNHIWSVAGDNGRPAVSSTFIQPFLSYTTPTAWTYTLNTEATYDWRQSQWTVPIHAGASKLVKIGERPVSFGLFATYWAQGPKSAPHGWGGRAVVTLLFPK